MNKYYLFVLTTIILLSTELSAQREIIGMWEFTSVQVGDQTMTPVAKWAKYNSDGTFQSGNGWTQNSIGTWNYNDTFVPSVLSSVSFLCLKSTTQHIQIGSIFPFTVLSGAMN